MNPAATGTRARLEKPISRAATRPAMQIAHMTTRGAVAGAEEAERDHPDRAEREREHEQVESQAAIVHRREGRRADQGRLSVRAPRWAARSAANPRRSPMIGRPGRGGARRAGARRQRRQTAAARAPAQPGDDVGGLGDAARARAVRRPGRAITPVSSPVAHSALTTACGGTISSSAARSAAWNRPGCRGAAVAAMCRARCRLPASQRVSCVFAPAREGGAGVRTSASRDEATAGPPRPSAGGTRGPRSARTSSRGPPPGCASPAPCPSPAGRRKAESLLAEGAGVVHQRVRPGAQGRAEDASGSAISEPAWTASAPAARLAESRSSRFARRDAIGIDDHDRIGRRVSSRRRSSAQASACALAGIGLGRRAPRLGPASRARFGSPIGAVVGDDDEPQAVRRVITAEQSRHRSSDRASLVVGRTSTVRCRLAAGGANRSRRRARTGEAASAIRYELAAQRRPGRQRPPTRSAARGAPLRTATLGSMSHA